MKTILTLFVFALLTGCHASSAHDVTYVVTGQYGHTPSDLTYTNSSGGSEQIRVDDLPWKLEMKVQEGSPLYCLPK
jgi:hypothetical protein